jgi:hypothetical protein
MSDVGKGFRNSICLVQTRQFADHISAIGPRAI